MTTSLCGSVVQTQIAAHDSRVSKVYPPDQRRPPVLPKNYVSRVVGTNLFGLRSTVVVQNGRRTQASAGVVAQVGAVKGVYTYGVEFVEHEIVKDFWGINLPLSSLIPTSPLRHSHVSESALDRHECNVQRTPFLSSGCELGSATEQCDPRWCPYGSWIRLAVVTIRLVPYSSLQRWRSRLWQNPAMSCNERCR